MKLFLHDSCGCPIFLGLCIHALRNCFGSVSSGKFMTLLMHQAVLLSIKASIFGVLQKRLLTHEFFIRCSLTWSHLIFSICLMKLW
jgi:hypothetical protein